MSTRRSSRSSRSSRAASLAAASLAAMLLFASVARAERDPAEAEAHARAARADLDMQFCRAPKTPLGPGALELCDVASEIPDCAPLVAACDAALKKPERDEQSDFMKSLMAALGVIAHGLVYVLVGGAVIALLVPIVNAIRKRRRDASIAEKIPSHVAATAEAEAPKEIERVDDAEEALRRADDLARRGDLTRATTLYLAASLSALDRRGAIRITKSRTNGEYVRACSEAESRPKLRGIANEVDRVHFGGEPPTEDRVGKVAGLAKALVRALPLAMLVLGLAGCGNPGKPKANDPAGTELFVETMKRQGMPTSRLGASLASLRPLDEGEPAPILVIDLDRTQLEPDAEDAVVAWTASGGVLVLMGTTNQKLSKTFGYSSHAVSTKEVDARLTPLTIDASDDNDDDESDEEFRARLQKARDAATKHFRGVVPVPGVVEMADGLTLVSAGGGGAYAIEKRYEKGVVVVVHDSTLLRNAVVARPGNAAAITALFTELSATPAYTGGPEEHRSAEARAIKLARREDGISPPDNPFSALAQAGLARGMWHALAASLVLFLAYGVRHARAKPEPAPSRRAFAEHVLATGAFYARSPHPTRALASFARFAEDRVRHALPRGTNDVPTFLAQRTGRTIDDCRTLWERATASAPEDTPKGDELRVLADLRGMLIAALRRDTPEGRVPEGKRTPT